jgi:hypothetical protein
MATRPAGGYRRRVLAALLAVALAAAPGGADAYDPFEDSAPASSGRARLVLTGLGGSYLGAPGSGRSGGSLVSGELSWSFDALDLGVQGSWARVREDSGASSPVVLLRLGQRFETRRGVEASFTLGLGAARLVRWQAWFQVAIGARFDLGPIFLAAELGFEQADLIRLAGGMGVRF